MKKIAKILLVTVCVLFLAALLFLMSGFRQLENANGISFHNPLNQHNQTYYIWKDGLMCKIYSKEVTRRVAGFLMNEELLHDEEIINEKWKYATTWKKRFHLFSNYNRYQQEKASYYEQREHDGIEPYDAMWIYDQKYFETYDLMVTAIPVGGSYNARFEFDSTLIDRPESEDLPSLFTFVFNNRTEDTINHYRTEDYNLAIVIIEFPKALVADYVLDDAQYMQVFLREYEKK